jgi:hypothetical protein
MYYVLINIFILKTGNAIEKIASKHRDWYVSLFFSFWDLGGENLMDGQTTVVLFTPSLSLIASINRIGIIL